MHAGQRISPKPTASATCWRRRASSWRTRHRVRHGGEPERQRDDRYRGASTTKPRSKIGIGLPVRFTVPFAEGDEWIIPAAAAENHAPVVNLVSENIAFLQAQGGAYRLRERRSGLAGQPAGDHRTRLRDVRVSDEGDCLRPATLSKTTKGRFPSPLATISSPGCHRVGIGSGPL